MAPNDIETRIAKALVTAYEVPEKERETVREVRNVVDRRRPSLEDREAFARALQWWLDDIPSKRAEHKKLNSALRDLKWYLAHRDKRRVRAVVTWVSAHPGQAVAAVGVLLAVILRVSHAQFYGRLRIAPEEVGLGSAELLAASLPGAMIVLAVLTGLVALIAMPQMAVIQAYRDRSLDRGRGHQDKRSLVIFVALVALNGLAFYLLYFEGLLAEFLPMPRSMSDGTAGMIIGGVSGAIGAVCGAAFGSLVRAEINRRRGLRPYVVVRGEVVRNAFVANAPTFAFLFLLFFLPMLAAQRADRVRAALAAEPVSFLGFPLLAVGAERTQLVDGAEHGLAGCVLYLGADDKNGVFFKKASEADGGTIVRVPSGDTGAFGTAAASSRDDEHCWSETATNGTAPLAVRLTTQNQRARAGSVFRVRYTASRAMLVRLTAWRGAHPITQVTDSAERGLNGIDLEITDRGGYTLTLVARGVDDRRVLDRARVAVR